jgi:hypothetical protein
VSQAEISTTRGSSAGSEENLMTKLRVVSRVPWKSSGVASAELGYLSRLRVVKPERRGVIAFREAA